jgi:hypothetical protein
MNWPLAISRNRTALLAVVATIVVLIGGREGGAIARSLRNAALTLLRPAEAAARRLIVIAARGIVAAPRTAPDFASRPVLSSGSGNREDSPQVGLSRPPAFRLFDQPKRFGRLFVPLKPAGVPRIRTFWAALAPSPLVLIPSPEPAVAPQDAPVDATRLRLRLAALERALADLPRQARRLARWRARRLPGPGGGHSGSPGSPLRLGHPPGWRRSGGRAVDAVLRDCHLLALDALASDTS